MRTEQLSEEDYSTEELLQRMLFDNFNHDYSINNLFEREQCAGINLQVLEISGLLKALVCASCTEDNHLFSTIQEELKKKIDVFIDNSNKCYQEALLKLKEKQN